MSLVIKSKMLYPMFRSNVQNWSRRVVAKEGARFGDGIRHHSHLAITLSDAHQTMNILRNKNKMRKNKQFLIPKGDQEIHRD
jgi:hypothetical protein